MVLALSSLVLPAAAMASGLPSGWDVWTDSGAFTITSDAAPDAGGRPASAVVVGWPAYTDSQTGWAGTVSMTLQLPAGGGARFEVDVADAESFADNSSERRELANLASYLGKERERSAGFKGVVILYAPLCYLLIGCSAYLVIRYWWLGLLSSNYW